MASTFDYALELIVVEATLLVLLASLYLEHDTSTKKAFRWIFIVLAALAVANFFNFGRFRDDRWVHTHEQYHFFLGSKYLPELRYDGIYEATVVRAVSVGWSGYANTLRRNLDDFTLTREAVGASRASELRSRFTEERWREFGRDLRGLAQYGTFESALIDHGNTGSPTWAVLAGLITSRGRYDTPFARLLASLDLILLAILFSAVAWTFGERTAMLAAIVGMSAPTVALYLMGSILRLDWLVALGLSLCLFEKRHFRTAGILLGYAVASKLLAGVLVIPLGLRFLADVIRERRLNRDHVVYVGFAILGLALFVGLAMLYFRDTLLWRDYYERMLTTFHEHYYGHNHSFRDLFLQALHQPQSLWNPMPLIVAANDPDVFISDHRVAFAAAQLTLLAGLTVVAVRSPVRVAFALGPLAVFTMLVTNRYYWQMWMISVIALAPTYQRDWRHSGFLSAILCWMGAVYVFLLSPRGAVGYFGSYLLFVMGAILLLFELIAWSRERRGEARGDTVR